MDTTPQPSVKGFVFAERLGAGSYATVYRAYSKSLGSDTCLRETVAIKCIYRKQVAQHKWASNNLVREIGILKTLRHKHIVQLKDFQWDDHYIYIIMEYCAGGDLFGFISRQRGLPEPVARQFLQQLADALAYLRSRNISHMDLKPQNILVATRVPPFQLKLADFGFATFLRDGADAFSTRGSPLYMAPEMLRHRSYDARVDLWSVGIILYECLFGRPPFEAPDVDRLMDIISSRDPVVIPSHPRVSERCFDLLDRLLQKHPDDRISFDAFFQHPFVDLDHAPTEDTWKKAIDYAKRAVEADQDGRISQAIRLYSEAVEYFLPSISTQPTKEAQNHLRTKIRGYLVRAEALKAQAKPIARAASARSSTSNTELDQLKAFWADVPQVEAALTVIDAAEQFLRREAYDQGLEKYTLAIESMLGLLQTEGSTGRAEVLRKYVTGWIDKAERIKMYLEVSQMRLSSYEQRADEAVVVEETTQKMAKDYQCSLQ